MPFGRRSVAQYAPATAHPTSPLGPRPVPRGLKGRAASTDVNLEPQRGSTCRHPGTRRFLWAQGQVLWAEGRAASPAAAVYRSNPLATYTSGPKARPALYIHRRAGQPTAGAAHTSFGVRGLQPLLAALVVRLPVRRSTAQFTPATARPTSPLGTTAELRLKPTCRPPRLGAARVASHLRGRTVTRDAKSSIRQVFVAGLP